MGTSTGRALASVTLTGAFTFAAVTAVERYEDIRDKPTTVKNIAKGVSVFVSMFVAEAIAVSNIHFAVLLVPALVAGKAADYYSEQFPTDPHQGALSAEDALRIVEEVKSYARHPESVEVTDDLVTTCRQLYLGYVEGSNAFSNSKTRAEGLIPRKPFEQFFALHVTEKFSHLSAIEVSQWVADVSRQLFTIADVDNNGTVDYKEFFRLFVLAIHAELDAGRTS